MAHFLSLYPACLQITNELPPYPTVKSCLVYIEIDQAEAYFSEFITNGCLLEVWAEMGLLADTCKGDHYY